MYKLSVRFVTSVGKAIMIQSTYKRYYFSQVFRVIRALKHQFFMLIGAEVG
jgi:hypothetical protein